MGIENFIQEAHYKPNDYIKYHVGRELAELHPKKAVITSQPDEFQKGIRINSVRSVAHCIDHHVDSDFVSRQAVLHWINGIVDPFPGVAHVAVTGDKRDEAAVLVFYAHVVRDDAALF